jgi:uncharacterized membrane protein
MGYSGKILLTQVVDKILFAPLGAVDAGLVGRLNKRSIEHEKVKLIATKSIKRLRGEYLHRSQITQLKREEGHGMLLAVIRQAVIGRLHCLGVPTAQNKFIWLSLREKQLDSLEALLILLLKDPS